MSSINLKFILARGEYRLGYLMIIMFVFHSCNESYALSGVCEKADITMILLYKNFSRRRLKMHMNVIFLGQWKWKVRFPWSASMHKQGMCFLMRNCDCNTTLQRISASQSLGFKDHVSESSEWQPAATLVSYCPTRSSELEVIATTKHSDQLAEIRCS